MATLDPLPQSLAGASQGMAAMPQVPMGQAFYNRYYRAAGNEDFMRLAIAAAEANPHVDTANAMTAQLNKLQLEADSRRDFLRTQAREQAAIQARLNAARLKAAGKAGSGRGVRFKELVDAVEGYNTAVKDAAAMYKGRVEVSDVAGTLKRAQSFGSLDALGTSAAGAIGALASTVGRGDFDPRQLETIAKKDAEGVNALRALQNSDDELTRASAAAATAALLSDKARGGTKSPEEAARFAAQVFNVPAEVATQQGVSYVQNQLYGQMKDIVAEGKAEQKSTAVIQPLFNEIIRMGIGQFERGGGGGALRAEQARQAAEQLTPQERGDLDLFLAALRNDGQITETETVSISGEPARTLTQAELDAGREAYRKAKRFKSFRADEAEWFDDQYLEQYRNQVEYGPKATAAREAALERGARGPEQVQREMAERFLRAAVAARDLEVYVDPEEVRDPFQQRALGGAMHIANREGESVFDLKANPSDRDRRLGGRGPLARAPMRLAQEAYARVAGPTPTGPVPPEALQDAVEELRKRFRRDPDKANLAVQYLLAQNIVMERQQAGQPTAPGAAEPSVDQDTPPVAPPPPPQATAAPMPVDPAIAERARRGALGRDAYTAEPTAQAAAQPAEQSAVMLEDAFDVVRPDPVPITSAPPTSTVGTDLLYRPTYARMPATNMGNQNIGKVLTQQELEDQTTGSIQFQAAQQRQRDAARAAHVQEVQGQAPLYQRVSRNMAAEALGPLTVEEQFLVDAGVDIGALRALTSARLRNQTEPVYEETGGPEAAAYRRVSRRMAGMD